MQALKEWNRVSLSFNKILFEAGLESNVVGAVKSMCAYRLSCAARNLYINIDRRMT